MGHWPSCQFATAANQPSSRNAQGRFALGNPGGPGRPPKAIHIERQVITLMANALADEDWEQMAQAAIRKAIAASLSSMLESLNQTLDHSLSWRSLQWRVTALRTGKSFAEIVLLNTLVYRVEQVLLIDRDTGLLLQHVTSSAVKAQDADMVSGMLTAIRDFARDSFRVSEDEALDQFRVGDLSVWVEQGPHAILATVIRGNAPSELRQRMQEAVEHVHAAVFLDARHEQVEAVRAEVDARHHLARLDLARLGSRAAPQRGPAALHPGDLRGRKRSMHSRRADATSPPFRRARAVG